MRGTVQHCPGQTLLIAEAGIAGLTLAKSVARHLTIELSPILREYFGGKLAAEIDFANVPRDPYPLLLPIFQQRVVRVLARSGRPRASR
jgi:hypothetical protein